MQEDKKRKKKIRDNEYKIEDVDKKYAKRDLGIEKKKSKKQVERNLIKKERKKASKYKVKKALIKDAFKEIKTTYKRFISIMLMALLGVGFFAGLRATSPDMVNTIDQYFKDQNVYDIEVISTLGLTDEDIEALSNIENVDTVYGTYSKDGIINLEEKEIVSKILCIDDVNKPKLLSGNMPQNDDECVVEKDFLNIANKQIGDTIEIETEKSDVSGEEETEYLNNKTLKIVGTVESPLYISRERGTTNLGSGQIDSYIYVTKNNVNSEAYTEIYIKLKDSNKYETSSNKYEDYVEETKDKIEAIKEERQQARYDSLIGEANKKIEDAENEFNSQKQEGESKIQEAEAKLQNGKNEIAKAENEIASNEKTANSRFAQGESQIKSAKQTLQKSEDEYNTKKAQAEEGFAQAESQKEQLQISLNSLNQKLTEIDTEYSQIVEKLKDPELTEQEKQMLESAKTEIENNKSRLLPVKTELETGITTIENQISSGKAELANAKNQIDSAKSQITTQEATLNSTKASTNKQIANAKAQLESSKAEIQTAEAELQAQKDEFNQKIQEAEGKIIDAKEEVSKIENPVWYILDRNQNSGYASFIQDTESINNLSLVFPIVFFAIAALVSLTSMTRMVEEERQELGTLKALGYNKFQISLKYILYSSLACIIGGVIGMNIGFQLLPRIVWDMYEMMYTMPSIIISFNYENATIGIQLMYICIVGATLYSILKELTHTPATLLRPKAPKIGKRVLLERITPIWKRLNFSQKVTIRNIFRYKKRFLMTIIGIFGCTSLILAGFGLKDSISKILPYQYENIFNYDMQIAIKSSLEDSQKQSLIDELRSKEGVQEVTENYIISGTASKDGQEDIQIIVPKSAEEMKKVISLKELKTEKEINLDEASKDGVIITDKLADLIGAKEGDTITIKDTNDIEKEVKVFKITENYISHYIYMSAEYYENLYGKAYTTNVLLLKDNNLSEEQEEQISKELVNKNEVSTISLTSTIMTTLDDTMNSLNYVVIILIVSAGLLAFVVLYNLSNVNISERIRELATIKVLGFYDKEVYKYVSRETVLLTAIGIALGLVGGYFLNFYIIGTCEIDMLRFVKIIDPLSYLYSILITVFFTIIVNIVTYFALKKIDMIGSLKSVE